MSITKCNLHFVNMRAILLILIILVTSGCTALSHNSSIGNSQTLLTQARKSMKNGELYQARKLTQTVLEQNRNNAEAQILMAEIIEIELSRYKEHMETDLIEEKIPAEKKDRIATWLERSQSLFNAKQYEEALLAAEKVFQYDADNAQASALIDEIRFQALKEGKQEVLIRNELTRNEIRDRVVRYRNQARNAIESGQWGAAHLAVQKLLLLEPEDKDGLKMQREILKQQKKAA